MLLRATACTQCYIRHHILCSSFTALTMKRGHTLKESSASGKPSTLSMPSAPLSLTMTCKKTRSLRQTRDVQQGRTGSRDRQSTAYYDAQHRLYPGTHAWCPDKAGLGLGCSPGSADPTARSCSPRDQARSAGSHRHTLRDSLNPSARRPGHAGARMRYSGPGGSAEK